MVTEVLETQREMNTKQGYCLDLLRVHWSKAATVQNELFYKMFNSEPKLVPCMLPFGFFLLIFATFMIKKNNYNS